MFAAGRIQYEKIGVLVDKLAFLFYPKDMMQFPLTPESAFGLHPSSFNCICVVPPRIVPLLPPMMASKRQGRQ